MKHTSLYLVLIAGGLWHRLGIFATPMRVLAVPAMVLLTCWLFWETWRKVGPVIEDQAMGTDRQRFTGWSLSVLTVGWGVEAFGVHTGFPFGSYSYGSVLVPKIVDVPLAIGFAWLAMLLVSLAVAQRLLPSRVTERGLLTAALAAVLMVLFDVFMEPAAVRLGYWEWHGHGVPLQNYVAWFVLSFLLAYLALRTWLASFRLPSLVFHAYLAQLAYFVLV